MKRYWERVLQVKKTLDVHSLVKWGTAALSCSILTITMCQPWSVGRLAHMSSWPWPPVSWPEAHTPWSLWVPLAHVVSLPPCSWGCRCCFLTLAWTGRSARALAKHCGNLGALGVQGQGHAGMGAGTLSPTACHWRHSPTSPTPPHAKHAPMSYSEPLDLLQGPSRVSISIPSTSDVFTARKGEIWWVTEISPLHFLGTLWQMTGCREQSGGEVGVPL